MKKKHFGLIADMDNKVSASIVSVWEIGIKFSIGKLDLDGGIDKLMESVGQFGLPILPVLPEHVRTATQLPFHHRDPFDRVLIAQAKTEGMHLLSADPHFVKL